MDPLATGLLLICAGKSTKRIDEYQGLPKKYTGTLVLGKTTPSVDLETEFDSESDYTQVTGDMIEAAVETLTGDILQVPPIYSAVKVDGQRAYKAARRKEDIKLNPRLVTVSEFKVHYSDLPEIKFEITCSKGTYIRSLVRDLGEALGCGAYMSELRRTAIGSFEVSNAYNLNDFILALQSH